MQEPIQTGPALVQLLTEAVQTLSLAIRESKGTPIASYLAPVATLVVGFATFFATFQFYIWTKRQREPLPELVKAELRISRKEDEVGRANLVLFNPGDIRLRICNVVAWCNGSEKWGKWVRDEQEREIPARRTLKLDVVLSVDVDAYSRLIHQTSGAWGITVECLGEKGVRQRKFNVNTNESGTLKERDEGRAVSAIRIGVYSSHRPSSPVRLARRLRSDWNLCKFRLLTKWPLRKPPHEQVRR